MDGTVVVGAVWGQLVADVDKLLVVNISAQTYAAKGKIAYPNTLDALMQP